MTIYLPTIAWQSPGKSENAPKHPQITHYQPEVTSFTFPHSNLKPCDFNGKHIGVSEAVATGISVI